MVPETESFPPSGKRGTRHPDSDKPWGIGRLQIDSTYIHKAQLGVVSGYAGFLAIPCAPNEKAETNFFLRPHRSRARNGPATNDRA
jgi:hypothetical protein